FCHGDCDSVRVIKKSLDEFSSFSGLLPNMQKSSVFFGGLSALEQQRILDIIPFNIGNFPMKYLGVPFITKKISVKECKPLVDKVRTRVSNWKNKCLSYAGRLQLIAYVLSSMQVFWNAVLLLPKQVVYDIERLPKEFLWCQGELTKGKSKVSWTSVCKPKEQGGLGLKILRTWNEVFIWEIECDSNSSFGWKSLLKLREKLRKHIWWKIENGRKVNVWHDTWSSVCPLSDLSGTRDMYDARLKNDCTISEAVKDGKWCLPEDSNNEFDSLQHLQVLVILNEKEYYAVWVNNLGHEKKFKTGDVWKDMCINDPKVEWYKMTDVDCCLVSKEIEGCSEKRKGDSEGVNQDSYEC
ncbi:hypothetical protein Tco_0231453, partial [Tanacetum coccineum]